MKAGLDSAAGQLTLDFRSRERVREFFQRAVGEGGFMVNLGSRLGFRQMVRVKARVEGGFEFSCSAEVTGVSQTTSGLFTTALLFDDWGSDETERLKLALAASAGRREEEEEAAAEGGAAPEAPVAAGETRGTSPIHRIRAMNPPQRTLLARKADRIERQILLKDNSPQVLRALLVNPRIESKDVIRLVKSTHAAAPLLKRVAEDGRWGRNQEILALVAKNPKTPSPVATRLIDKLRTSDLRWMAKLSSGLRENIRRAALREYLKRTGG